MNNPLISIVIPSYNSKNTIIETFESVKNQIYENWECIIVDDGSTDDTIFVIKEYIKKDVRFTLIQRNRLPKGGSVCRNIGLEHAKGEYLIFLDSDDLFIETTLQNRVQKILENPTLKMAIFSMGPFQQKIGDSKFTINKKSNENPLFRLLSYDIPWQITSPIWQISFLRKLGGFNELYPRLQDPELHTRALLHSECKYKIFIEENPDCFYRLHNKIIRKKDDDFFHKVIEGFCLYIQNMSQLLIEREDGNELQQKYLKKILFIVLKQYASKKYISFLKIIDISKKTKLISFQEELRLRIAFCFYYFNLNRYYTIHKFIKKVILSPFV